MKYRKADEIVVDGNGLRNGVVALVVGAVVIGGGGYGLYELAWAAKANNVQRTGAINRESLAFQAGREDDILQKMPQIDNLTSTIAETTDPTERGALTAQKQAVVQLVCADYDQLNPSYIDQLGSAENQQLTQLCAPGQVAPQQ